MSLASPDTASSRNGAPLLRFLPLIFLLFLGSGISGLIYEVIWTRLLLTVFGATLYAVTTVLAAYMGGLALGSFLGGRVADRIRRPLAFYGALEIVIGLFAVSVPFLLTLFDPIYRAIYAGGSTSFLKLSLIRFGLSFLVLLIPTTCMGATLPMLSRFLVRRSQVVGSRIGGLYAINTFGAVLGVFLAGFILLARLGVSGTAWLAAALSILVGVVALALSAVVEKKETVEAQTAESIAAASSPLETPAWLVRIVLLTYGISGFIALAYQVFWSRTLVFRFDYLKNTTYSFSAMLTVFLVGLALGSALMSARIDRQRNPVRLYGLLQILTGLSGAFSLFMLIYFAGFLQFADALDDKTMSFNWMLAVANIFLRTVATIGLPTFLMGMAFPVVARICVRHLESVGKGTGRLYAVNTLGAILGSFAAGFILIPAFGLAKGLLVLGLANVILGVVVLALNPADSGRNKIVWTVIALLTFGAFAYRLPQNYFFHNLESGQKIVEYREGPLATVAVVEDRLGYRTIYIDNVGVAGTDPILLTDQKSLAHVPMLFLKNPKSALTVGFGSGGASYSYTLYPELERIDCIEICQTVPEVAYTLKDSNHGLLDSPIDPRYRIIFDDARSYLRFSKAKYDIIATDCTDLRYKSNANLYDLEYFKLCKEAITDDGMVVVWMPLGGMAPEVFGCALRTFAEVFPDMSLWYMNNTPTHYLLLIGTRQPLKINIDRMMERIQRPEITKDLAEVYLQQPEKILSCYLENAKELGHFLNPAPLNTENRPHLEFESPKYGYTDEALLDNIEILRKSRNSAVSYLEDAEKHPDFIERLHRFEKIVDPILAGHAAYRRLQIQESCQEYLKAAAICPEDASVQYALTFDDLKRRMERNPSDVWAFTTMGEVELLKKDYPAAANAFDQALSLMRGVEKSEQHFLKRSVLGLAQCYLATQRPEKAMEILDTYGEQFKDDADFQKLKAQIAETSGQ